MDLEESFMDEEDKREVKHTEFTCAAAIATCAAMRPLSLSLSLNPFSIIFSFYFWTQNNTCCQVMAVRNFWDGS